MLGGATAEAYIYTTWSAPAGFDLESSPFTGLLAPQASGNSTLAQLIWSADNVADTTADMNGANYMSGEGDVWLASFTVSEDGIDNGATYDDWAIFGAGLYDGTASSPSTGYIYGRIFQDDSLDQGDLFYIGSLDEVVDYDPDQIPIPNPQAYSLNDDRINGDTFLDVTGTGSSSMGEVVPEPASLSLLALGAVVIGIRRRRS
jgi:hypothetical protein